MPPNDVGITEMDKNETQQWRISYTGIGAVAVAYALSEAFLSFGLNETDSKHQLSNSRFRNIALCGLGACLLLGVSRSTSREPNEDAFWLQNRGSAER